MAFKDQVEDLTSIAVSDDDELSEFLKDGVIDVTNRWILMRPQDIELFGRETATLDGQGSSVGGAQIISVIREANADGSSDGSKAWEPCRKIPLSMKSRAVDPESFNFASLYNPVFTLNSDKTIHVYPVPTSNNGYKIFYVNEEPRDITNNAALIHSHSNIKYFPNNKVYLVVLFAGIKLVQATMGDNIISIASVPPSAPSAPNISVPDIVTIAEAIISDQPSYTKPLRSATTSKIDYVSEYTFSNPGAFMIASVPPEVPSELDLSGVGALPTYSKPSFSYDTTQFETFLEDQQDVELAQSQMGRLQHELGQHQSEIQNELNEFNKENAVFQAELGRSVQVDNAALQKYQAQVGQYQAEVSSEVQEYTQKLQYYLGELAQESQEWSKTESDKLQVYQLDIQNELNDFNKENAEYQANIQNSIVKFQADAAEAQKEGDYELQVNIQNYTLKLQLYQAEISVYQAEVSAEIQEESARMQHYQLLYTQLKSEYDQAFIMAAPQQQQARG